MNTQPQHYLAQSGSGAYPPHGTGQPQLVRGNPIQHQVRTSPYKIDR